jgi:small subunit ribosomal protein S20
VNEADHGLRYRGVYAIVFSLNHSMPNTTSAAKAHRQSIKRRARNLSRARAYKSIVKEFRKAAATDPKKAAEMMAMLQKKLDKAAKSGVIKKNKAARLKSGAAKLLAKAKK